ncbi:MAG: hypothetical protein RBQ91_00270 [Acholeplasma sp.]|nr:hypothetical protein [Acholeplasma sp.]
MRKLLLAVTLLAGLIGLAGCNLSEDEPVIHSEADVMNYAMVSAANLMDVYGGGVTVALEETTDPIESTEPVIETPQVTVEETDEVLEKYLNLIETYLSNEALTVNETISDRVEFETMITYKTKDLLGDEITYVIYYNEVVLAEETEDIEEDELEDEQNVETQMLESSLRQHEYDKDFEDEFDDEIELELQGLIVVNGYEFELVGRKEIEEDEVEIKFIAYFDQDNYIRISYEKDTEDGEEKFHFKQMSEGVLISESKIKLEQEDGELKVMLTHKTETTSSSFMFKQSDEASYDIMVKYDIKENGVLIDSGHIKIDIIVDDVTGETTYDYQLLGTQNGKQHQNENGLNRHRNHGNENKKPDNGNAKR